MAQHLLVIEESFIKLISIRALFNVGRVRKMKKILKTDPNLVAMIDDLKAATREGGGAIWRDIAKRLEKPRRNWAEVNLSRLERYANDGDVVIVPGKVLAAGSINKKLTVAAYSFSDKAAQAIVDAGGQRMTIMQLVEERPDGKNVRIMG
jgi:large subunit ribosomal protein L18e